MFFKRSSSKERISKDVRRWLQIQKPDRLEKPLTDNLIWLLEIYPEFRNVFYYRLGRFTSVQGKYLLNLAKIFYEPLNSILFSDFSSIGPGLFVENGSMILVGGEIGDNCWLNSCVTIGYKTGLEKRLPIIGNNVYIGTGAKILGSVTIGNNVMIGANAVVTRDVPSNCTVVGVPARIVKRDGNRVDEPLPRLTSSPK